MIDEAVALAKESDVAIMVLGGNEKTVREEYSRTNLDLCGRQEKLLQAVYATGKPVILVMIDGRAATINWAERYIPGLCTLGFRVNLWVMQLRKLFSAIIIRVESWR